nr:unnamed protein product [Digitaria exilis]
MLSPTRLAVAVALLLVLRPLASASRPIVADKPAPSEATATARWLAAQNSWGVLRSIQLRPNPAMESRTST